MKNFFSSLSILTLSVIAIAYIMDWVYTYSYENGQDQYARDKVSWLEQKDSSINYDYALFGSSRCIYHLNPMIIDKQTGLSGINLGYSGSNSFEIKLMVKKFISKYNPSKIFIQVDDRYNIEHRDPVSITPWIPFIKNDYIYEEISQYDAEAYYLRHLPFYRYTQYETSLGFRNVLFGWFKENSFDERKGFTDLRQVVNNVKPDEYILADRSNKHLEEIEQWCIEKNIELYFFTSPYLKRDINTDVLAKHLNNYHDFSQIYSNLKLFKDPTHLNWIGAEKFTNHFTDHYFDREIIELNRQSNNLGN